VTLHFPDDEKQNPTLTRAGRFYFPNAIELDDAPKFERFFFLTSRKKIDVGDILSRARVLANDLEKTPGDNIDVPPYVKQSSILIVKGEQK
jgi:hypothetical protein